MYIFQGSEALFVSCLRMLKTLRMTAGSGKHAPGNLVVAGRWGPNNTVELPTTPWSIGELDIATVRIRCI